MRDKHSKDSLLDEKTTAAMKDGRAQKGPFKKKRANQELTRGEVEAIKIGRKNLRKEMRLRGLKSRKEFELTASSMGLYFDKNRGWALLLWLFHGRGLWALLGALAALLAALFLFSTVTQMQGHFTINMSEGMFREGFSLSETIDFVDGKSRLFCDPALNVPCFSISDIHSDVDDVDGQHNEAQYFAYTYYIRNEGENTVGYDWFLEINSESSNVSEATWIMIFEDGKMTFHAKAGEMGGQEALPAYGDNSRGYLEAPFLEDAAFPEEQYEIIATRGNLNFYRVIPLSFESEYVVRSGTMTEVHPQEVHKYTVVIWLEGDDPDCTDDLIGGHLGMDMAFRLISEEEEEKDRTDNWLTTNWDIFWDNLIYYGKDRDIQIDSESKKESEQEREEADDPNSDDSGSGSDETK